MGDGGVEAPAVQLALGGVVVLAQLDQGQGEGAGPLAHLLGVGVRQAAPQPLGVLAAQRFGEVLDLPPAERGQAAPDGERVGALEPRLAEGGEATDGVAERGHRSAAEPDRPPGRDHVEVEAVGLGVEAVGEVPEEPDGRWAEDAEPEALDVPRARVVAQGVDDRVDPGLDVQGGGQAAIGHGGSSRRRSGA